MKIGKELGKQNEQKSVRKQKILVWDECFKNPKMIPMYDLSSMSLH